MLFFRKLFRVPTPQNLGLSDTNALPLRQITPDVDGYCWEDYYEILKKNYPVKYFFSESLPNYIRYKLWFPIKMPLSKICDYCLYNFHPKYKYHLLDLRQSDYKYGWKDLPDKMLYAMFNLVDEFIKNKPYDLSKDYTLEEINNDVGMKVQHETYQEAQKICHWWQVERKNLLNKSNDLLNEWSSLRKDKKFDEDKIILKKINQIEIDLKNQTEEMLIRLIKIRENLYL